MLARVNVGGGQRAAVAQRQHQSQAHQSACPHAKRRLIADEWGNNDPSVKTCLLDFMVSVVKSEAHSNQSTINEAGQVYCHGGTSGAHYPGHQA